jgi:hypothetical protein
MKCIAGAARQPASIGTKKPMAKKRSKAGVQPSKPGDVEGAIERIAVKLDGNKVSALQLFAARVKDSFRDGFTQGPVWKDTFVDGGQFLSNFNNLKAIAAVQHPAVQLALQKLQKASKSTK